MNRFSTGFPGNLESSVEGTRYLPIMKRILKVNWQGKTLKPSVYFLFPSFVGVGHFLTLNRSLRETFCAQTLVKAIFQRASF
jgi:hypothetical protein